MGPEIKTFELPAGYSGLSLGWDPNESGSIIVTCYAIIYRMNKTIYKVFGILLIVLTIVFIASSFFAQISTINTWSGGWINHLYEIVVKRIFTLILIFIFGFFPGLFFYRFGNENNESIKLVKSAIILQIISLLIALFLYIISLSCGVGCDSLALIGPMFILGIPALILYGIGILFMIIYKFKTRNFKLRLLEKIVLSVLALMLIFVWMIYSNAHL